MKRLRRRRGRSVSRRPLGKRHAPRYTIDGETETTMSELIAANRDAPIPRDYVRAARALDVGQSCRWDFGAGGVTEVRRIS